MNESERPSCCVDAHLCYLDELRESGVTNMFGAARYLINHFRGTNHQLNESQAALVLSHWMETFPRQEAE